MSEVAGRTHWYWFKVYGLLAIISELIYVPLHFGTHIPALPEFLWGWSFVFGYWAFVAPKEQRTVRTVLGYPILTGFAIVGLHTVVGLISR